MRFLVTEKLGPHKFKTPEGYLICTDAILSRTGKQEYKRCELFGDACEDPDKIVNVERTDDEVFSDKAMASFENKAVCIEHPDHDVNAENHNELAVGFVRDIHKGEDNGKPVMMGTLVITDKDAVEAVESGEYKELSCGYDCDIDDDDEPCQRNIRGNHVALCKQGRAGIARIVDSVKDAWTQERFEELIDEAETKRELDLVVSLMMSKKSDTIWQSADAYRKLVEKASAKKSALADMNDFAVMRFDFSTNIAAFERAIVNNDTAEFNAMLPTFEKDISDYHRWKVEGKLSAADIGKIKRQIDKINNLLAKSSINKRFEVKDMATLKDDEYVQLPRGRFKLVAKTKEELEKEGYGYHHSDNGYSVYVKNNSAVAIKDAACANDANYEQWTVVEEENYEKANKPIGANDVDVYRRQHEIVVNGKKYKPYYVESGLRNIVLQSYGTYFVMPREVYSKYVDTNIDVSKYIILQTKSKSEALKAGLNTKDSLDMSNKEQLFTIEYEHDGVMYVRKVRANSIEDAISKVKDDAHKVVIFTNQVLNELGKNNSIGKYDRVVQAMRSLYSESLLPDDELKTLIRKKVPEYIKKYVKE